MIQTKEKPLNFVLYVDFFITFVFGVVSWLFPYSTYGNIVSLSETGTPLTLSAFSSLSLFYIFLGIACFIAAKTPNPQKYWFALLMMLRHGWAGIIGISNAHQDWIIGNPWLDVVIHSVFVFAYIGVITLHHKHRSKPA